jgi:hypothetical protein
MNTNDHEPTSLAELAEQATDLAARAAGCALARLIERYVPPRLADRFALRVAVVLLREVHAHDVTVSRTPFSTEH